MQKTLLAALGVTAFLLMTPSRAAAQKVDMNCCTETVDIIALLNTNAQPATVQTAAVQTAEVWFKRPTVVGRSILQGRYIIEHDNDRQARGEPCSRIYAYNDRTRPVAEFHCVHLERGTTPTRNVVTLNSLYDGWQELTEFQFAGDSAAHGYPYPDRP